MLSNDDDIKTLKKICQFVYVDPTRGLSPDLRYVTFGEAGLSAKASSHDEIAALRKTQWSVQTDFSHEIKTARVVHGMLERGVREVVTDLSEGRHLEVHKLKDAVDSMVDSILRNPSAFAWLKEMKHRNFYSYQHAMGCAIWSVVFGRHLGLEKDELQTLSLAGLLADVGKIRLPADLLVKPGALDERETALARRHVEHSLELIKDASEITPEIVEIIATHHERNDGSGYPHGLAGNHIPIFGRIMGLVDSYDAMTSNRPYSASRSPHKAVGELYEHRGSLFQADLVEQFIQACGIYPIGSIVELTNGQVGVITAIHSLKRLRPTVMVLLDKDKRPLSQFVGLDLTLVEHDEQGHPLSIKGGLPLGAYGIDPHELFVD